VAPSSAAAAANSRYDRSPVGALQGLAPDRVVYGGSVSKTLAPGLRMGWVVAPAWLAGTLADVKHWTAQGDEPSSRPGRRVWRGHA
jgi:DNA-binding transcriptional MocR family regulator